MKRVLVPFAKGVEEIEFVAVVDILRRADIQVTTASFEGTPVTGRSGIVILPDARLSEVSEADWDMIVLPGGQPNAQLLRNNGYVKVIVHKLRQARKTVAAICAAPTALAAFGVIESHRVTSFPGSKEELLSLSPAAVYVDDRVVEDDFLVTSRGAGTAVEFALRLVSRLCGEEKATEIKRSIVAK